MISRIQPRPHVTLLIILVLMLAASPAAASVAGAHSLQIPPGARANGLGQASVALADDATASWWNPAGLGFMRGRTLGFMHSQLVPDLANDIYYEYGGWVHHLEDWGTYSLSLIYLSYGESVKTTSSPDPEGTFNSFEFSPAIAYGVRLDRNTAIGLGLKYVRVDLAPVSAVPDFDRDGAGSSVAVDLGFLRRFGHRASLGAVLSNFGPNISFINEEQSDPLPRHLKLGGSYLGYSGDYGHILLTGDFNKMLVEGGPTTINAGTEFDYMKIMAFRLGYVHDPDGDITDLTFGGGFHVKLAGRDFYLDYASIPQASDLDRVHRFSFEILFPSGAIEPVLEDEAAPGSPAMMTEGEVSPADVESARTSLQQIEQEQTALDTELVELRSALESLRSQLRSESELDELKRHLAELERGSGRSADGEGRRAAR